MIIPSCGNQNAATNKKDGFYANPPFLLQNIDKAVLLFEFCYRCVSVVSGKKTVTLVPLFSIGVMVKVAPMTDRRSRMLFRARCGSPLSCAESPGPLSSTMITLPVSVFFVRMAMRSGSSESGSIPYLTEFSTMGCKVKGGTRKAR